MVNEIFLLVLNAISIKIYKYKKERINPDSIWSNVMKYWCEINFESASVIIQKGKILDINRQ